MFRFLRGLALFAALGLASPALATTCAPGASCSITQASWTDLGAGPLQVDNTGLYQAQLAISTDSTLAAAPPGPPTTYLGPGGVAYFTTAAHVWAQASGPTGATIRASVMATPATSVNIVNPRTVTPDTNLNDFHATNLGVTQLHNDNGAAPTGVSPPAGGSGTWGWLSGIYQKLAGTLSASIAGNLPDTAAGDVAAIRSNTSGVATAANQTAANSKLDALHADLTGGLKMAGGVGADYSTNAPTLPNVGSNFDASGPYANYVLVKTIPASASRANIDIENISGGQIAVVLDDGTAANGAAPVNASVFTLGGGTSAGAQGGAWSSQTCKRRVQIYAPVSTAQVTVFID
jgi:hypothetical protein